MAIQVSMRANPKLLLAMPCSWKKNYNIAELQLRVFVNAPSSSAYSWVPFAHMGDDHHCLTENSLPAERNITVA